MKRKIAQSEGDVNTTPARQKWQAENLSDQTRQLLEEDQIFLASILIDSLLECT